MKCYNTTQQVTQHNEDKKMSEQNTTEQNTAETEIVEKGHYSYKELKDNKVKYSNMSSYEQTNYMNGLYDESMIFLMFIIVGVIIIFIILCFFSFIIYLS